MLSDFNNPFTVADRN